MYLLFFHPLYSYTVPSMLDLSSTGVSRLVRSCIAMAAWGTIMREGAQNGGRALNGGANKGGAPYQATFGGGAPY